MRRRDGEHRGPRRRPAPRRPVVLVAAGVAAFASTLVWLPAVASGLTGDRAVTAGLPSTGSSDRDGPAGPAAAVPAPAVPAPADPEPGAAEPAPARPPAFAASVPPGTTQVVRTVRTDRWCAKVYCTRTEAWEKTGGQWRLATGTDGGPAVFRSTIGPRGFAPVGGRRHGDDKTPSGVYAIVVTFSATDAAPGRMPWRPRLPTSVVSGAPGKNYNTWIEKKGLTNGDRPSMRYGFWLDYNNPRLAPGVGPAPVPGVGSGIFFHTSWPGQEWVPTIGCVALGNPEAMKWVLTWLDPAAQPRVVNNL